MSTILQSLPTREEFEQIKMKVNRMPKHIPGRLITVKLEDVPLFLEVNHLKPDGLSATGAMLVKKVESDEETA